MSVMTFKMILQIEILIEILSLLNGNENVFIAKTS